MFLRIARDGPVGILGEHLFKYRWGHGNADQYDRLVRLGPDPYFAIVDEHLAGEGGRLAQPEAVAAHAAHFAEDQLMRLVNHYVLGRLAEARPLLREVRLDHILASRRVRRGRLAVLHLLLQAVMRLPRSQFIAALFYRRWYARLAEAPPSIWEDPLSWLVRRGYA
jgi:hypothetical protein